MGRASRICRERAITVRRRRNLTLCQIAIGAWMRALRAVARERRAELEAELAEVQHGEAEVDLAVSAASRSRHESELSHLKLLDELHAVVQEQAALDADRHEV